MAAEDIEHVYSGESNEEYVTVVMEIIVDITVMNSNALGCIEKVSQIAKSEIG